MQALLEFAVAPVNIVFTGLLILVLFYWLSVIFGALDMDAIDFDFDVDAGPELDIDADADIDTDVDADAGGHWMAGALQFFNFGKLPFMVIMSVLVLSLWSFAILTNHYWGQGSAGFALAMLLPNLAIGLLVAKIVTAPLAPVFAKLDGGAAPVDYIGQECTLRLAAGPRQLGQAEVIVDGNPLLVNVQVDPEDGSTIAKGQKAYISKESADKKYFLIRPIEKEITL